MNQFNTIRYFFFGTLLALCIITLGLAASDLEGFPLAVSVLTLVIVIVSVAIDFFRKGAFTSMVIVEIAWTSLLVVLWVAAAGYTSTWCFGESLCQGIAAITWLGFICVLAWLVTLIYFAATAHSRGNTSVWKQSVTETNFMARIAASDPEKAPIEYQHYPSIQPLQQQPLEYSQQPYPLQPAEHQPTTGHPPNLQHPAGYNASPGVVQV